MAPIMTGRIFPTAKGWKFEARLPSGGGWFSKTYRSEKGARHALNEAMRQRRAQITAAQSEARP